MQLASSTNSWLSVPALWLTWRQAVGSNPGAVKAIKLVSNTDIINLTTAIICNGQGQIWPILRVQSHARFLRFPRKHLPTKWSLSLLNSKLNGCHQPWYWLVRESSNSTLSFTPFLFHQFMASVMLRVNFSNKLAVSCNDCETLCSWNRQWNLSHEVIRIWGTDDDSAVFQKAVKLTFLHPNVYTQHINQLY